MLNFDNVCWITDVVTHDVEIDIGAWYIVKFAECEIIGEAATGSRISIGPDDFGQHQIGGGAIPVYIGQRAG